MKNLLSKLLMLNQTREQLLKEGFDIYSRIDIRFYPDADSRSLIYKSELFLSSKDENLLEAYNERGLYPNCVFGYKSFDLRCTDLPFHTLLEIKAAGNLLKNKHKLKAPKVAPFLDHVLFVSKETRSEWIELPVDEKYDAEFVSEFQLKLRDNL